MQIFRFWIFFSAFELAFLTDIRNLIIPKSAIAVSIKSRGGGGGGVLKGKMNDWGGGERRLGGGRRRERSSFSLVV